ncbi:MAG: DUF763 domain-containing protein [Candidatus Brocadiales bacterium]|nr:DUF763 domain-containing protein [Candidatus Bathyanammoxibius sp.]
MARFSKSFWFQSFHRIPGLDWRSSGLTTTTLEAENERNSAGQVRKIRNLAKTTQHPYYSGYSGNRVPAFPNQVV